MSEIDEIKQELERLSHKKVELERAHQDKVLTYHKRVIAHEQKVKAYEQQKTIYQRFFGQPPLQLDPAVFISPEHFPDPEIELLNSQMEHWKELVHRKAGQPEIDWSESPFFSHTLKGWNFHSPMDQLGFYMTSVAGVSIVSKAFWRAWNVKMASEILKKGIGSAEPGQFEFHMHNSGLESEKDLGRAMVSRGFRTGKAVAVAGLLVTGYAAFVQLKYKKLIY